MRVSELLGVFSSKQYEYVHYPWKDNEFCHLFFRANLVSGNPTLSEESTEIGWFSQSNLPILSDGHEVRVRFAFEKLADPTLAPHFE